MKNQLNPNSSRNKQLKNEELTAFRPHINIICHEMEQCYTSVKYPGVLKWEQHENMKYIISTI